MLESGQKRSTSPKETDLPILSGTSPGACPLLFNGLRTTQNTIVCNACPVVHLPVLFLCNSTSLRDRFDIVRVQVLILDIYAICTRLNSGGGTASVRHDPGYLSKSKTSLAFFAKALRRAGPPASSEQIIVQRKLGAPGEKTPLCDLPDSI